MNRQQAKEFLPIMQAYAEGNPIEFKDYKGNWVESEQLAFNKSIENYRIKPEPKYRPFKDARECWQEMHKHGPVGWIKAPHGYFHITGITNVNVNFGINDNWINYEHMLENYKFIDDTPFGIEENA